MNLTLGSLELNRINQAHMGPVNPVGKIDGAFKNEGASGVSGLSEKKSFEDYLLEAVNEVNSRQIEVSALQEQVITDPDSVDIHDVTTAMAKAQMSLNLAQTVIDRLVKGWTDLSQNR